jgi:hypothetical protein
MGKLEVLDVIPTSLTGRVEMVSRDIAGVFFVPDTAVQ